MLRLAAREDGTFANEILNISMLRRPPNYSRVISVQRAYTNASSAHGFVYHHA